MARIDDRDIEAMRGSMADVLCERFGITNVQRSFSCPSPDHRDSDPSAHYYADTGTVHCFGCGKTWDVFSLVGEVEGIDNFVDQAHAVAEILGISLANEPDPCGDTLKPARKRPKKKRPPFDEPREAGGADCSEACGLAFANLYAPEGIEGRRFLFRRGLDDRDIARWGLGFVKDPKTVMPEFRVGEKGAAGFVTIPFWNADFTKADYCMMRTVSAGEVRNKEWRPAGLTSPLWNEWMLTASLDVVMVAEGLIDAMALAKLTEKDGMAKNCMALGGVGGAKRLVQILYHAKPEQRPGLLVVCMDQDAEGKRTRDKISADLCKIGVAHICTPAYPNGAKDADEWLMAGKGKEWEFREIEGGLPDGPRLFGTRWFDG